MFYGERPEYTGSFSEDGDSAYISVSGGKKYITVYVKISYRGSTETGICRVKNEGLDDKPAYDRAVQRALKNAFYKAGVKITGKTYPWGALTGVRPGKIVTDMLGSGCDDLTAVKKMQREYFVTKQRAELCLDTAKASFRAKDMLEAGDAALYIGVPFCPTRCAYCSFVSIGIEKYSGLIEPFVKALIEEIRYTGQVLAEAGINIVAVYFGGGTPTTLSADQLDRVLAALYRHVNITTVKEFTVEAGRPDTITLEKLEVLKRYGVQRLSINPQTMSDRVLEIIGRRHSADDVIRAYEQARRVGFEALNMDLIAGLPGDSPSGFERTLKAVAELEPENITVHTLSLKKGARILLEGTEIPDAADVGKMLDGGMKTLRDRGYRPYYLYRQKYISGGFENIGWTKAGYDSLYNILIMEELCTIVGLGGGASTKLVNPETGRIERTFNPKYPKEYIENRADILEKKKLIKKFYEKESYFSGR